MLLLSEALLHDNKCIGLIRLLIKKLFEACWILIIITPTDLSGLWKNSDLVSGEKKTLLFGISGFSDSWLIEGRDNQLFLGWAFPWRYGGLWNMVSDICNQLVTVASLLALRQPIRKSSQQIFEVYCMFFSCIRLKYVAVILYDRLLEVKHHDFANSLSNICDNYINYYSPFTVWPND